MTRAQQAALWACVLGLAVGLAGGAKLWSSGQDTADDAARAAHRAAHAAAGNRQTLCAFAQLVADVADPTDTSKFGRDSRVFLAHVHDINCPPNAVSFPKGGGHGNGGGNPGGRPGPPPGGHHHPPPHHKPPPDGEPKPDCTVEVNPSVLCLNVPPLR